jgi:hypothetical protein
MNRPSADTVMIAATLIGVILLLFGVGIDAN